MKLKTIREFTANGGIHAVMVAAKHLLCVGFVALAWAQPGRAQSEGTKTDPEVLALASLPYSFIQRFIKSELSIDYVIGSQAVNPFYLTGDFDGDGQMDYILRLQSKADKQKEEDAVFFAEGEPRLLSKDIKETYPGPAWYVVSKKEKISLGANDEEGAKPPEPKGDSIMMVRPESSSALVFWNGKSFELFWQGD
ncbi:MAG: hypothetical protein H0V54_06055 [Chthoniobacterales bacterium]|nr:hypothetical protein [Chthoniobacterales bacterium]